MARLFGTDGVRGVANGKVLNAELAYKLGRAAAQYFGREVKAPKLSSDEIPACPAPCWKLPWQQASAPQGATSTFWA